MASYCVVRTGPYNQGALCPILFWISGIRSLRKWSKAIDSWFLEENWNQKSEIGIINQNRETWLKHHTQILEIRIKKFPNRKIKHKQQQINIVKVFAPSPLRPPPVHTLTPNLLTTRSPSWAPVTTNLYQTRISNIWYCYISMKSTFINVILI